MGTKENGGKKMTPCNQKKKVSAIVLVLIVSIVLLAAAGCGKKKDETKIVVGASPSPHAEILSEIVDDLKKEGVTLEIREFSDYKTPNIALADGDIDANYFQHIPYFVTENREGKFGLEILGGVHVEPMALYSTKHATLEALPDGAEIMLPNDTTNEGRALLLLQEAGLIRLNEGVSITATPQDIADNPKHLTFTELEAAAIPRAYQDADGAVINGNYAIEHGLNPVKDAILIEGSSSPYVNIVAVKEGRAGEEALQKLLKALQSEKVKTFIENKYGGAVIPAFQSKETADKLGADY